MSTKKKSLPHWLTKQNRNQTLQSWNIPLWPICFKRAIPVQVILIRDSGKLVIPYLQQNSHFFPQPGGLFQHFTNSLHIAGDRFTIALRPDIYLENIFHIQIHSTVLYARKSRHRFLITEPVARQRRKATQSFCWWMTTQGYVFKIMNHLYAVDASACHGMHGTNRLASNWFFKYRRIDQTKYYQICDFIHHSPRLADI